MSVKKQAAYVCDVTGQASMDENDFFSFKIPGQRKYRHVHKSLAEEPFGATLEAALAPSNNDEQNPASTATDDKEKEPSKPK